MKYEFNCVEKEKNVFMLVFIVVMSSALIYIYYTYIYYILRNQSDRSETECPF